MNSPNHKSIIRPTQIPKGVLGLFFIAPFIAFIHALHHYRSPWAYKIFTYFAAFFGFTFVLNGDAIRVANGLEFMRESGIRMQTIFSSYFSEEGGILDLLYRLITFVVSVFTGDYRFLLAILSLILAYFITRSVWFLVQRAEGNIRTIDGLILIAFAVTVQLWYVGGRWNLASVVFAYGLMQYVYLKNIKYLFLALFAIFIHWSFLFTIPIVVLYLIVRNRSTAFFLLFVVSFIISFITPQDTQVFFSDYAPSPIVESRSGYLNDNWIEYVQNISGSNLNWYVRGHTKLLNWLILATVSYIFLYKKKIIQRSKELYNLFNFSMLFFGVANLFSSIPSMNRFFTVGQFLFLAIFFLFIHETKGRFHSLLTGIGGFVLVFFIIVRIRVSFDAISAWTIFGNPFYVYFVENSTPIIDLIKKVLPI